VAPYHIAATSVVVAASNTIGGAATTERKPHRLAAGQVLPRSNCPF
jgi:hypothetical protein